MLAAANRLQQGATLPSGRMTLALSTAAPCCSRLRPNELTVACVLPIPS